MKKKGAVVNTVNRPEFTGENQDAWKEFEAKLARDCTRRSWPPRTERISGTELHRREAVAERSRFPHVMSLSQFWGRPRFLSRTRPLPSFASKFLPSVLGFLRNNSGRFTVLTTAPFLLHILQILLVDLEFGDRSGSQRPRPPDFSKIARSSARALKNFSLMIAPLNSASGGR